MGSKTLCPARKRFVLSILCQWIVRRSAVRLGMSYLVERISSGQRLGRAPLRFPHCRHLRLANAARYWTTRLDQTHAYRSRTSMRRPGHRAVLDSYASPKSKVHPRRRCSIACPPVCLLSETRCWCCDEVRSIGSSSRSISTYLSKPWGD
jgi:hypothetical protein